MEEEQDNYSGSYNNDNNDKNDKNGGMEEEEEYEPCIVGLCGRSGCGKSTVESFICEPVEYKQMTVTNRLKYIGKVLQDKLSLKDLKNILNKYIENGIGDKLDVEGSYKVWRRDKKKFNVDMYNALSFAEPIKIIASIIFNYDFYDLLGLTKEQRKRRNTVKTVKYKQCKSMTGKECLQFLGTDVFRNHVDTNIWLDIAVNLSLIHI